MEFCFLGTSGAVLKDDETTSSLFFRSENYSVMIDCPGNAISILNQIGCSPLDLDGIVLTHAHPDHISGLPFFIQNLLLIGRKKELILMANPYTKDKIQDLLQLFNLHDNLPFKIEYLSQESGLVKRLGPLNIEFVTVCHSVPTSGVLISDSDYRLFYTSDTAPIPDILKELSPLNTLIHEASGLKEHEELINKDGHSSGRQAAEITSKIDVERLFLCHFDYRIDDVVARTILEAEAETEQKIFIPERMKFYQCKN
jgi:ribonuclease Z